jgi:excisionase family DNA binding protein
MRQGVLNPADDKFLTAMEAAALLRISLATMYRLLENSRIPGAFRVGGYSSKGSWRIDVKRLDEWTAQGGGSVK